MKLLSARVFFSIFIGIFLFMQQGCASSKNPNDNFPSQADFPDYQIIDARNKKTLIVKSKKNKKIAVVVRNLAVTAYSNLEQPRYDKEYTYFEGMESCCAPKKPLMGASGLLVYRFHTLNKAGNTQIELIARHKGLSMDKKHYDSDSITHIDLRIK